MSLVADENNVRIMVSGGERLGATVQRPKTDAVRLSAWRNHGDNHTATHEHPAPGLVGPLNIVV
jgi:hypothetical protein